MFEYLKDFYENIVAFDLVYLIITLLSLIKCSRKGFVLSVLEAAKWLLAYVITLILFPKIKPYVDGTIESEYILDIILGIGIFVIVIFVILMINKSISKAVKFSGLGKLDTVFGFFFGFLRGYIICVCIFSTISIFYNYNKWPINTKSSWSFSYVEKGSNYLLREFPDEKKYRETKEKIKDI
tara:strand:- start:1490 stop:2035 length:546 start_codon:yes stop_codon:yes gene_type:complete